MSRLDTLVAVAARYHDALTAALPLAGRPVGARALVDGPTAGELLLESEYGRQVQPQLAALYTAPIVAGLATWETERLSRPAIIRWILEYYHQTEAATPLGATFRRYARRGFNLGGQMGLGELGLPGAFELTDETILARLDEQAARLVDTRRGARLSVAVTTAEEIGDQVVARRDEAGGQESASATDMLPLLSAWVLGRTVIRSSVIATTETVRMTRWGMVWAFAGNGIRGVRHECEPDVEDRCGGRICPPLCGLEYELRGVFNPMGGIPGAAQIPLHPRCRCHYSPLQDGWVKPALIWTGFVLEMLSD